MRVTEKDLVVDRTLMAIEYMLTYHAGTEPDSMAAKLKAALFPSGANFHTRWAHVEQVAANERVLSILESEEHARWFDGAGLRPLIDDLRRAHDEFEATLMARNLDGAVGWEQVKAARLAGQDLYLYLGRVAVRPRTSIRSPASCSTSRATRRRRGTACWTTPRRPHDRAVLCGPCEGTASAVSSRSRPPTTSRSCDAG
jgi:hypothetical protein